LHYEEWVRGSSILGVVASPGCTVSPRFVRGFFFAPRLSVKQNAMVACYTNELNMGLYGNWIQRWERELATKDTNRIVRPFEWGLDWLDGVHRNGNPARDLTDFVESNLADSERFYSYATPSDFRLTGNELTFTSPVSTPYPSNNTAYGDFFPAAKDRDRAVLVLPQWNSDINGHVGLCKLLNRFGVTALRMSMAYHDRRMPPELTRADYHMSSNLGRTISAMRQSVIDARCCLDWLQAQGYKKLAILGTSLGSCVAFVTAAHDLRIRAGVFNHVSTYVSDVVWTGISTRHVKEGLGGNVSRDDLKKYWSVISPAPYLQRMVSREMNFLLIWARYDTTFLPEYSRQVLDQFRKLKLKHKVFELPCAHYTTGKFPFNLMDGLAMCRYLRRHL
jgi:hypothetical protein